MNKSYLYFLLSLALILLSCGDKTTATLPILGKKQISGEDTIYHTIPPFSFLDQNSKKVTNASLSDKVYIIDYFFTSCPSICPKVKKQMLRLYTRYKMEDKLQFVSITMDPKRDTPEVLKTYADNLGVDSNRWWFLSGDKEATLDLAEEFFIVAYEDDEAPGGFDHSGKIILVDRNGHIRAFAEGTDPDDVDKMFGYIDSLLQESESQ